MTCWLVVDEVRPKPSCIQRSTTVPVPSRARLRIAWNATCGSSEQAWMQRSPPAKVGVELVAGQRREVGRAACGFRAARPKRSSKSEGPKPIVMVSFAGDRP